MKRFYKQFALSVIILYLIIAFVLLVLCFCFAPIESAVYQLGDRNVFVCLQRDFSNRNIYAYFDDSPDFKDISRNIEENCLKYSCVAYDFSSEAETMSFYVSNNNDSIEVVSEGLLFSRCDKFIIDFPQFVNVREAFYKDLEMSKVYQESFTVRGTLLYINDSKGTHIVNSLSEKIRL